MLKLFLGYPTILGRSVDKTLAPAVSLLLDMGISPNALPQMLAKQPYLLVCKPERHAEVINVMQRHGVSEEVSVCMSLHFVHIGQCICLSAHRTPTTLSSWQQ